MNEARLGILDAKTVCGEMFNTIVYKGRSWVQEKAKSIQDFPVLPNGQRGLQIGWGFGFAHIGRRKILQPDGALIWLSADYTFDSTAEEKEYTSKLTLSQVESAIAQLKQQLPTMRR